MRLQPLGHPSDAPHVSARSPLRKAEGTAGETDAAAWAIAAAGIPTYLWAMLRFLSRALGFWLVAAGLVAAVVDGAKSIGASAFVTTSLTETWAAAAAFTGGAALPDVATAPWPLNLLFGWLFAAPTVAVLLVPGVLFLAAGAKRRRHNLGREFAA